jgi:single-strand DNA-binding protein
MSEGLNRVTLLGNLGADPELRYTQGGGAVLNIRLATTESYLDKDKQRKERTDWHSVTVWGKRAEALAKLIGKGSQVLVEGRLSTSSYEKDGEKRYRTEVLTTNLVLVGSRGERRPTVQEPREERRAPAAGLDVGGGFGGGDDIPF